MRFNDVIKCLNERMLVINIGSVFVAATILSTR